MMREPLGLPGVYRIRHPRHSDLRGAFERIACQTSLEAAGLTGQMRQLSLSENLHPHTIRGLHYQADPCPEMKLVRVLSGRVFDVVVDVRPESASFGKWCSVELDTTGGTLYIPPGFAHGFQTLEPNTVVLYAMSEDYVQGLQRGLRWDDPNVGIAWPMSPTAMSSRDESHPSLQEIRNGR